MSLLAASQHTTECSYYVYLHNSYESVPASELVHLEQEAIYYHAGTYVHMYRLTIYYTCMQAKCIC